MIQTKDIIINGKTLADILDAHKHWVLRDYKGYMYMRADLRNADLRNANLCGADLRDADLCDANLYGANLYGANLCGANLYGANLYGANLCDADLYSANLCGANLYSANLYSANLYGANLYGANLRDADLCGADLRDANLYGANLYGAKAVPYIPMACPSEGAFIGWKKVNNYLIKLRVPAKAKRCSATTRKCRCNMAKVVAIYTLDGKVAPITETTNFNYFKTEYVVGEMVYPDSFDEDRFNECAHGIHFFINKQDAIDYRN